MVDTNCDTEEENWLQFMIDCNQRDDQFIAEFKAKAKDGLWWFNQDGDESHLKRAEVYTEFAQNLKDGKYTIAEIRKQRENVQWAKKQIRVEPSEEQSRSSSHSEN